MTLLGYCVRRAGDAGPDAAIRGVNGAEVRVLEHRDVGIWISPAGADDPTPEHLREYDQVVRVALRTATPLPLRFGARFESEADVEGVLDSRRDDFLAALERVAGRVEVGITLLWDEEAERARIVLENPELRDPESPPASGRDYLEARRRTAAVDERMRSRAEGILLRAEHLLLGEADVSAVRRVQPRSGVAASLALLVGRNMLGEYRRRVAEARVALPEVCLAVSGPWAPYSFV